MTLLSSIVTDEARTAPLAFHAGRLIARDAFLSDVEKTANELPDRTYVINQCAQRYPFMVAFVAALARGQTTLLPPDATVRTRDLLDARHDRPCTLTDVPADASRDRNVMLIDAHGLRGKRNAPSVSVDPDRTVAVVFTSGTTGEPVEHPKTWSTLQMCVRLYVEELELPPDARILATVPPQHMYGFESSILLPLSAGMMVHSGRPSFPSDVRSTLGELSGPRVLVTTPVHLRALVASRVTLPQLALIVSAAAPLSEALARAAAERFGTEVAEVYGCTEAGILATRRTLRQRVWRLARSIELRADGDTWWASGGHIGDVRLHDCLEPLSDREFLLLGRSADMVNVAGKRASLSGLDSILLSVDGVEDGAFFVPAEAAGSRETRLSAVVVAPTLSSASVRAALRTRIDSAFIPREIYVVPALPRNATGKLTREALLDVAARVRSDPT